MEKKYNEFSHAKEFNIIYVDTPPSRRGSITPFKCVWYIVNIAQKGDRGDLIKVNSGK